VASLAELLLEHGIRPRDYREGNYKLPCPHCSHARRKLSEPCLSLAIEGDRAVWLCHHCQWKGAVSEHDYWARPMRQRKPSVKPTARPGNPTPALLRWFAGRGISGATIQRNRVGTMRNYIPALGTEVECIAFPYFRGGEW
jgi:twinkle protein